MQIKDILTKEFVEILLHKLKVGDSRSIYFNAFPGKSANKLDIVDLDEMSK